MARTIQFHLDEHIGKAIATGLRRLGIDVTTTPEKTLLGVDDSSQLAFATLHKRVLVTCDADFLRMHSMGMQHHGIVYVRDDLRQQVGAIIRYLELLWEVEEQARMFNRVEYAF